MTVPAAHAEAPAEAVLLTGLFLDGSLALPAEQGDRVGANAAVATSVAGWLVGQAEADRDVHGPLVVPTEAVDDLLEVKLSHPVDIVLSAAGSSGHGLRAAVDAVTARAHLSLTGVVVPWASGWTEATAWGVPVSVAVSPTAAAEAAEDIAFHTSAGAAVQAAFPAGGDLAAVAQTIRHLVDLDLGFCVTGGAPGLITGSDGTGRPGCLNLLAATRYALAHAAEVPLLLELLASSDEQEILDITTRMSTADGSVVRAFLTGVTVKDPAAAAAQARAYGLLD